MGRSHSGLPCQEQLQNKVVIKKNLLDWTEQSFEGNQAWSRDWMQVWAEMDR